MPRTCRSPRSRRRSARRSTAIRPRRWTRHYSVFAQGLRRSRRAGLLRDEGEFQPGGADDAGAGSAPAPTWSPKASCAARSLPAFRPRRSCFPASARRRARWTSRLPPASSASTSNPSRSWSCCRRAPRRAGKTAPVSLRINPDVDAKTHAKISTGKAENKFGIPLAARPRGLCAAPPSLPGIKVTGIDMHIGSQITDLQPFDDAFALLAELVGDAARRRPRTSSMSISAAGSAFPTASTTIRRRCPTPMPRSSRSTSATLGLKVIFEPGRLIVGNAGILVTEVIYREGRRRARTSSSSTRR